MVTDDKLNDAPSGLTADHRHVTQLLRCFPARPKDSRSVKSKLTSATSDLFVRKYSLDTCAPHKNLLTRFYESFDLVIPLLKSSR